MPDPKADRIVRELAGRLESLPDQLREPLMLRTIGDLSYAEIAARLNLTETTVRKRVQLARDRLRRGGGQASS